MLKKLENKTNMATQRQRAQPTVKLANHNAQYNLLMVNTFSLTGVLLSRAGPKKWWKSFSEYSVDRGGSDELSFNSVLHKNYNS